MEERRASVRRPVKLPVHVQTRRGMVRKWVEVEARNISEGGLAFETQQEVSEGAEVQVMVAGLGGLPDSAHVAARVVYSERNPTTGTTRVGVEFTAMVDVTWRELLERLGAGGDEPGSAPSG